MRTLSVILGVLVGVLFYMHLQQRERDNKFCHYHSSMCKDGKPR